MLSISSTEYPEFNDFQITVFTRREGESFSLRYPLYPITLNRGLRDFVFLKNRWLLLISGTKNAATLVLKLMLVAFLMVFVTLVYDL